MGHNDFISCARLSWDYKSQVSSVNIICKTCNVRLDIKKGSMEKPSIEVSIIVSTDGKNLLQYAIRCELVIHITNFVRHLLSFGIHVRILANCPTYYLQVGI